MVLQIELIDSICLYDFKNNYLSANNFFNKRGYESYIFKK